MGKQKFVVAKCQCEDPGQKEILISLLSEEGYDGFWEDGNDLQAYIQAGHFDNKALQAIAENMKVSFTVDEIEQRNWNQEWEDSFKPVSIPFFGREDIFVHIRASFHEKFQDTRHEIVITPKMSFGTGHHATTFLMVQQMADIDFAGKTVVDFGTGTGILAILAEQLGAAKVIAIDNDDWSIENAAENIAMNQCRKIDLFQSENLKQVPVADVILANINLNVILANLSQIAGIANAATTILFSGILIDDFEAIKAGIEDAGLEIALKTSRDNWLLLKVNVHK